MSERGKKILFIVNPKSGKGSGIKVAQSLPGIDLLAEFNYEITITNTSEDAYLLATKAAEANTDYVVACGGDGTVNEIARALANKQTCLCIIPKGSGNGLARHLKIPFDLKKNLGLLNTGKIIKADSMLLNGRFSINVSGAGFDAHVAALFANTKGRGFLNYVKLALAEYKNYKPFNARINIDSSVMDRNLFLIAFANSAQFGNDFKISPAALVTDKLIDVSMVARPSVLQMLQLAWGAFNGTISNHRKVEIIKGKNIDISFESKIPLHVDGEPGGETNKLIVTIQPATNNILVPQLDYDV